MSNQRKVNVHMKCVKIEDLDYAKKACYYTDHKSIVVCVIQNCENSVYAQVNRILPRYLSIDDMFATFEGRGHLTTKRSKFLIANSYKGVARCSAEDEFDLTTGMDLAFKKAYNKYMRALRRGFSDVADYLATASSMVKGYIHTKRFEGVNK